MKLFQNMVIHDLRSPAEAIHVGLSQLKMMMNDQLKEIFEDAYQSFDR